MIGFSMAVLDSQSPLTGHWLVDWLASHLASINESHNILSAH
jgi:hypothetical protein